MSLQPEFNRILLMQRLRLLLVPVYLLFLLLGARLWQLQIIQGAEFAQRAERNRVRTIQLVAPRGTITDRNNSTLVENRPSFNIFLYRESMKDLEATSAFVTGKLGVRAEDFENRLRRSRSMGLYRPVVIKEDVGIDDISVLEAHRREHPELQLGPEPRRLYRYGKLAAHILGYVGEVSEDELAREVFPGARVGDIVGKAGVERIYNELLTGTDGRRHVLVDSLGREVGHLHEVDSVVGGELRLTIDLELQQVANAQLAGKVGVIIAMDPRNGEILAIASEPAYDPNSFSTRISEEEWNQLLNDPHLPLHNRGIQGVYPPGSVFKLIMAEAGLAEGFVEPESRLYCTGSAFHYNRVFLCGLRDGHGSVDLETAIARSCNVFFYELGKRMGISRIAAHAEALGLGSLTGIDLPGERAGVMPSPEWKQRVRGSKWYPGETISVSIGQSAVSTTPLQILRAVSAIATDGRLTTPHVLLRAERQSGHPGGWPEKILPLRGGDARRIRQGMWTGVNSWGTGMNAAVPGVDVCGKTGTVQVLGNERRKEVGTDRAEFEDHAWFAGFASRDDPEIAVVVFLENGGKGGVAAAPLAREVIRAFYESDRPSGVSPQWSARLLRDRR